MNDDVLVGNRDERKCSFAQPCGEASVLQVYIVVDRSLTSFKD